LLEADGAQVLYLPPYSPEFNRIEKCSAWLKSRIRKQLHHHWEGVLYPHQLPPRQELDCYIQHYQTVEVNSTYYRGPPNATFAFLAFAPPPRISDDRKNAPRSNALQASLLADRIHGSESQGFRVFVYFNNDGEGNAVRNASGLKTFVENGTS
jgi:uncharacterized protein YecE (DUF72 family)